LNQILQLYDTSTDKTKAMTVKGSHIRRVKVSINGKIIEQVNSYKCLGCDIATYKMNMDLEKILKNIIV